MSKLLQLVKDPPNIGRGQRDLRIVVVVIDFGPRALQRLFSPISSVKDGQGPMKEWLLFNLLSLRFEEASIKRQTLVGGIARPSSKHQDPSLVLARRQDSRPFTFRCRRGDWSECADDGMGGVEAHFCVPLQRRARVVSLRGDITTKELRYSEKPRQSAKVPPDSRNPWQRAGGFVYDEG